MTDEQRSRPSMVDVARLAGVAHVTVSRVINEPASVRPETRRRVESAIQDLGYRRNDMARALRRGRAAALGLVLAGSELFELPRILFGVDHTVLDREHSLSMASWRPGRGGRISEAIDRLVAQGATGVVVIADRAAARAELETVQPAVPVAVVMSGELSNRALGSVEVDQVSGARAAARHLLDLGHREMVHIAGPAVVFDARACAEGWRAELRAAGMSSPEIVEGDFSARSGFEWAARLTDRPEPPTAIFAGNDQMALGVLAALSGRGLRVPRDVSVVGFDDIAGADFFVPGLTTVRQDFAALGRRATELVFDMMSGAPAGHLLIEPVLMVRSSTAPPQVMRS